MEEEKEVQCCVCCNTPFDEDEETFNTNDGDVCQNCLDSDYGYCDQCNETLLQSNITPVNTDTRNEVNWCSSCLEDAIKCDSCGRWFTERYCSTDANDTTYCHKCSENYVICESCECWTSGWDEDNCCPDCSRISRHIHDYDMKPNPYFHPPAIPSSSQYLYLGVELETDEYRGDVAIAAENCYDLSNDEDLFYLKEDSSLDDGFEIVTHPCTLAYHQNEFPWKEIIQAVRSEEGLSHDAKTCGLHVHFNKSFLGTENSHEEEMAILKLMFLFEKFWENIVKFSRRTPQQLDRWAAKYDDWQGRINCTRVDEIDKVKTFKHTCGHGYAVNLQPYCTIELRVFRGTLNLETLLATLEFTDFLVRTATTKSANTLYRAGWKQLIKSIQTVKYPNLVAYLKRRNLCA